MIKPRPIALAVIALTLALAGAMAAYAAPRAARNASAGPTVNLVAAARGCAVVHIALHGAKAPTITCLRPASPGRGRTGQPVPAGHSGRAIFSTSSAPCNGAENFDIEAYSAAYCFTGSGYLGLNPDIYQVLSVAAEYKSWVRHYYNSIGTYFNLPGTGGNEYFIGPSGPLDAQDVNITQVCDDCGYHS